MNVIQRIADPLPTSLSHCCCYYCCCYCYLLCPAAAATAVATTVTCCCCYLLLLLLATAVTTAVPCHCCYSLHCCYLLQYWFARCWRERIFPVHGQLLAPLIRQLGIVCLVTRSFLAPLLSYYFATDSLLADTNLSCAVESDTFSC